jgi:hypothetical protein
MNRFTHTLQNSKQFIPIFVIAGVILVGSVVFAYSHFDRLSDQLANLTGKHTQLQQKHSDQNQQLASVSAELKRVSSEDQFVRNEKLEAVIESIEKTYTSSIGLYEDLVKLKESVKNTDPLDKLYAVSVHQLAEQNYSSAEATLVSLKKGIQDEQQKLVTSFAIPEDVTASNQPPASGFSRQRVDTPVGSYLVNIISADLNSTRVIVDTASDGTCANDCPVTPLGTYAARSGAFAAINGPYFCPASYPSCAGKTNSFDTLLMNKNKVYFNSENNVYSTVPAVIFSGSSARYVGQSSQWGRDTGVDSVIANQPLLTLNGERIFGGDGEPKREGKGSRSFVGSTGSTVYIGVVHNVSAAEMAHVLHTLGIHNSLNLDSGGSTALWSGGRYVVGPGRDLPFGILFVRK